VSAPGTPPPAPGSVRARLCPPPPPAPHPRTGLQTRGPCARPARGVAASRPGDSLHRRRWFPLGSHPRLSLVLWESPDRYARRAPLPRLAPGPPFSPCPGGGARRGQPLQPGRGARGAGRVGAAGGGGLGIPDRGGRGTPAGTGWGLGSLSSGILRNHRKFTPLFVCACGPWVVFPHYLLPTFSELLIDQGHRGRREGPGPYLLAGPARASPTFALIQASSLGDCPPTPV
jgi:hypothetical protein